jgi:hypothetical protein
MYINTLYINKWTIRSQVTEKLDTLHPIRHAVQRPNVSGYIYINDKTSREYMLKIWPGRPEMGF